MKRRKIRTWVKVVFVIIIAFGFIKINNCFQEQDEKVIKKCQQENSLNYCYKLVYGN